MREMKRPQPCPLMWSLLFGIFLNSLGNVETSASITLLASFNSHLEESDKNYVES